MALSKIHKLNIFGASAIAVALHSNILIASDIDTNTARIQALDKITGKVNEIDIPVDGEAKFGRFSIVIRRCVTRSPEEPPENIAFVDIADTYNQESPLNIFKGWMFSSSPALNAVEHPIYDIWLLKCYNNDTSKLTKLSAEELIKRDALPMQERDIISINNFKADNLQNVPEVIKNTDSTTDKNEMAESISVVVDKPDSQAITKELSDTIIINDSFVSIEAEENGFEEDEDELNENAVLIEE